MEPAVEDAAKGKEIPDSALWVHGALSASNSLSNTPGYYIDTLGALNWNGIADLHADAGLTYMGAFPVGESIFLNGWINGAAYGGYTMVERSLYTFAGWSWGAMAQAGGRMVLGRRSDPLNFFLEADLAYAFEQGEWFDERRRIDGLIVSDYSDMYGENTAKNLSPHGHSLSSSCIAGFRVDIDEGDSLVVRGGMGITIPDVWECFANNYVGVETPLFAGLGYQIKDTMMIWVENTTTISMFSLLTGLEPRTFIKAGVSFRL